VLCPQGKWVEILDLPAGGPPKNARGLCPEGGLEYAAAVFHYARTLALAAQADGAKAGGDLESAVQWFKDGAVESLNRLRVTRDLMLWLVCVVVAHLPASMATCRACGVAPLGPLS
jgi:hypothetical protein